MDSRHKIRKHVNDLNDPVYNTPNPGCSPPVTRSAKLSTSSSSSSPVPVTGTAISSTTIKHVSIYTEKKKKVRRSLTRSLTRSPTPIKYDYDIYKKRSPTFGRRCPVLNRRPRGSKSDIDNRSKSTNRQEQVTTSQTSSTGNSNRNGKPRKVNFDNETMKPVSSRISSGSSKGRSIVWDNPSYFQHDDRESQLDGKKVSRKRKPRQSPFRWQHDLFEDDGSPLEKAELMNQRKEAKLSVSDD
uniref:Uncharacterized protein n=1 Tax=Tetranychus urticae TaxID=32264 RepID=T1L1T7_TETUR